MNHVKSFCIIFRTYLRKRDLTVCLLIMATISPYRIFLVDDFLPVNSRKIQII